MPSTTGRSNPLVAVPDVRINSDYPDTINGFLPFQVLGYNFVKQNPRVLARWDQGTGKTVLAAGTIKSQQAVQDLIVVLAVVELTENIRREFESLAEIDSLIVKGSAHERRRWYKNIRKDMEDGICPVVITNYEKLKTDKSVWLDLVANRRVFVVMDEPSKKLRHRSSVLYKSVTEVFWTSSQPTNGKERPSELKILMLDGTPARKDPETFFNVIRLLDSDALGNITEFERDYVARRNIYGNAVAFKNVTKIGDKVRHLVNDVDKRSSYIAKQFPKERSSILYCDMSPAHWKLYNDLLIEYNNMIKGGTSVLKRDELISAINVFQMICNNPVMVLASAANYQDFIRNRNEFVETHNPSDDELAEWSRKNKKGSATAHKLIQHYDNMEAFSDFTKDGGCRVGKMLVLRNLIEKTDEKLVVFSFYAELGIPRISEWLTHWGITHVQFVGSMGRKARQEAHDRFKSDSDIKVFLASDIGEAGLNLQEANHVISYELPTEWATKSQRDARVHRVTSDFDNVQYTSLVVPHTVEDRRRKLIKTKKGYHDAIFKGSIAEESKALTNEDLLYVLLG